MTAKQMWKAFLKIAPEASGKEVDAWHYSGEDGDRLAELTARGIKTATSSAYPVYEAVGETLPQSGEYSVVTRRDGTAVCVVYTSKVYVIPYKDVSEAHAWREGEGDRTLSYWRKVHQAFFTECLEQQGLSFSEDMGVVCEEFSRVFPPVS